jgi:fructose-bisphosphate aldolase class II
VTIVRSSDAFAHAIKLRQSLAAFNVITLEHAQAIVWGAESVGLPVILQLSQNAIAYHRDATAVAAAMVRLADRSSVDCVLHLDHITQRDLAHQAIEWGFSSVMWDSSESDVAENLSTTSEIVAWAKSHGIWIEAELGEIGGKNDAHAPGVRTRPDEASAFVAATKVDALAVAVGSSHAMTDKSASLDLSLISQISQQVDVPLVLHGSSGVPDGMLQAACRAGVVKINIGTALNQVATGEIRRVLAGDEKVSDPRRYLEPAREQMARLVAHSMRVVAGLDA